MISPKASHKPRRLEDAIEIVVDKEDDDFGRARVRTREKQLPENHPGFYYPAEGLETDDYHWLVVDGFYDGKSHRFFEEVAGDTHIFPIVDLSPTMPKRPSTASKEIEPFFKECPKFEDTKKQLRRSVSRLKIANDTTERELLRSRGRSRESSPLLNKPDYILQTPFQGYDFFPSHSLPPLSLPAVTYTAKEGTALHYMQNGIGPTQTGLDNVPILVGRKLFDSQEVEKLAVRKVYGEESVMNVRHNSEFFISPDKHIPVSHMDTCLYRNARKFGFIFDQKAQKRNKKREEQQQIVGRSKSVHIGNISQSSVQNMKKEKNTAISTRSSLPPLHFDSHTVNLLQAQDGPRSARGAPRESPLAPSAQLDIPTIRQSILSIPNEMKRKDSVVKESQQLSAEISPTRASLLCALKDTNTSPQLQSILQEVYQTYNNADDNKADGKGFESRVRDSISDQIPPYRGEMHGSMRGSLVLLDSPSKQSKRNSMVGFTYTADNKLGEVVLQSEQPKARPSSASKTVLSTLQAHRHAVTIHTTVEHSLVDLIALKQKRMRRKQHPRKDLNNLNRITSKEAAKEFEALVDIYKQCGGRHWLRNENWCREDVPIKYWYGVGLTVEGYVFELNLPANNLRGVFPDQISQFQYIETVCMDDNELTGILPDYAIQKCQHLQILSVQNNHLTGVLHFNNFNDLNKIREIWLTNNHFHGPLQEGICSLTSLTHLSLSKNKLQGPIPTNIGRLCNLLYLSLAENDFSGPLPQSMIAMAHLQTLSLHNNKLSGRVPDWLFALTCPEDVWLFSNSFDEDKKGEEGKEKKTDS